jgi:hypothetical protein
MVLPAGEGKPRRNIFQFMPRKGSSSSFYPCCRLLGTMGMKYGCNILLNPFKQQVIHLSPLSATIKPFTGINRREVGRTAL